MTDNVNYYNTATANDIYQKNYPKLSTIIRLKYTKYNSSPIKVQRL